jgi:PKD repeat protein
VSPVTATSQTSTYTFSDTPTVSGSIRLTNLSDAHCPADNSGLDSIVVTINPITASFTASQTYIHLGDSVVFTSTSAGAVSYRWTFGDGDSSSVSDPVHTYGATGVYTVTLTVINANGCSSTISKLDTVTFPLGISKVPDEKMFNIYSYQNRVMVDFSQFTTVDATIQIYNVLGQVLSNDTYHSADTYEKPLDLDAAYVIVRVRISDGQVAAKKLFIYK